MSIKKTSVDSVKTVAATQKKEMTESSKDIVKQLEKNGDISNAQLNTKMLDAAAALSVKSQADKAANKNTAKKPQKGLLDELTAESEDDGADGVAGGASSSDDAPVILLAQNTQSIVTDTEPTLLDSIKDLFSDKNNTKSTGAGSEGSGAGANGISPGWMLGGLAVGAVALGGGGGGGSSGPAPDTIPPVIQSMTAHSSNSTIVLTYDSALDAVNKPSASAFVITTNGISNTVASVSINGSTVTLTMTNSFSAGPISLQYVDPTTGNDVNAIQDESGNDAVGFTQGILADGYIRDAQIYIDTNGNGRADSSELLTGVVTDEAGNFFLPSTAPSGTIIAVGGVNIDTGVPNTTPLKAPTGSLVINPLTTLVQQVIDNSVTTTTVNNVTTTTRLSVADAATKVAEALNLVLPTGSSLVNYDPLSGSGVNAVAVQKAAAQVATIVALASATTSSNSSIVLDNIADIIIDATSGSSVQVISLANTAVITDALVGVTVSDTVLTDIRSASAGIGNATTLTGISLVQSEFLDNIAPGAPTISSASLINTTNIRVALNVSSTDGTAAVEGDTVKLKDGNLEIGQKVLTASDIALGYADISTELDNDSHSLTALLTDKGGNTSALSAAKSVSIDTVLPTVSSVAIASATGVLSNTLNVGDVVTATVTVSEAVAVTGSPQLALNIGGTTVQGTYDATNSTSTILKFNYTIQAGQTDANGISIAVNSLGLNGGTILDLAGNAAVRTHSLVADNSSYAVDTTAPTLAITSSAGSLKAGQTATITFTFSEDPGSTFTNSDITLSGGTLSTIAGDGLTRTATFTPTANTAATASITVASSAYTDAAGNNGGAGTTPSLSIDTILPTVSSVAIASATGVLSNNLNVGDVVTATVTVSEAVAVTGSPQLALKIGDTTVQAAYDSANSTSTVLKFNYTIQADQTDANGISIAANSLGLNGGTILDLAGNAATITHSLVADNSSYAVDTTAPTLGITSSASALKAGETATITFTFSEDPGSTFTNSDITLSGGTLSTIAGTGLTRTATFTPTANTAATASITVASTAYTDAAGNNGGAGTTPSLTIDNILPTVSPSSPLDNGNSLGLASNLVLSASETLVKGTGTVSIYKADGTLVESINVSGSQVAISGTGSSTRIEINPTADLVKDQQYYVRVSDGAFLDAAGNAWSGISTNTAWNFTGAGASVTLNTIATDDKVSATEIASTLTISGSISAEAAILAAYQASDLTVILRPTSGNDVTLSSPVYSHTTGATTATWSISAPSGSFAGNQVYTVLATFTGASGAAVGVVGEATKSVTVGANAPTVSSIGIASATGASSNTLNEGDVVTATVTMSKAVAVTGSPQLALKIGEATVQGVYDATNSTSTVLKFNYTIQANQTDANGISIVANSLGLNSGTILDLAGNAATITHAPVADNSSYAVDTTAPTLAITRQGTGILVTGNTETITFTFSEDPGATFINNDITLSGGTLSTIIGSGLTRTATFTPTANTETTASITVASSAYTDAAGNNGGAGTTPSITIDTKAPAIQSVVFQSFNATDAAFVYKITSNSEVDWSKSLINITGAEQTINGLITLNSLSGYTLDPSTQIYNSSGQVWETALIVFPRDGVTPVSVSVGLTPKDSLGNTGDQVSSVAKTILITNAYGSDAAATLTGGSANDILFTDHAGDILIGGAGADALYIASNIAATVKLAQASDSTLTSYDTVTGFTSNDSLDISGLVSAYTSLTTIPSGSFTSRFTFENVTVNQSTHVATADVVYHGASIMGGDGAFDIYLNNFGRTIAISNEVSSGGWSLLANNLSNTSSQVSGFSSQLNSSTEILTDGQRVFTVSFQLTSNDSSFLFSSSNVLIGVTALGNLSPKFAGIPNSNELVIYNDGTSLGTVGDNSLHYAQDSNGISIKYDTNAAAGVTAQSAEIYIAGITSLTNQQLITVI